jgi:hypothetical protein
VKVVGAGELLGGADELLLGGALVLAIAGADELRATWPAGAECRPEPRVGPGDAFSFWAVERWAGTVPASATGAAGCECRTDDVECCEGT